ncbi:MAG: hypothetical protein LCH79_15410 [Proteobacteria bacterium]|nr:hypothetical protein [Pseudomonadota bacterium]
MTSTTLAAVLLATLAAGCAAPSDRFNPPADHCVHTRPAVAVDAQGAARTVQECTLWYFGPSREQDTRFRRAGGL